jgi:hypothetical protein
MDKILREMQRDDDTPPLHPVRRWLWLLRRSTYDLTGPGRLLPLHFRPRALIQEER